MAITTHEPTMGSLLLIPQLRELLGCYSDTELVAAVQLVQLSSGCDTGADAALQHSEQSLVSSSRSSPLSVSPRPFAAIVAPPVEEEEGEGRVGPLRRKRRCRRISAIYAATRPVGHLKENEAGDSKDRF